MPTCDLRKWPLESMIIRALSDYLQTDDVGIFCSPLSNEYLLLAEHFGLKRKDLAELNKGAIDVSFGSVGEKERLRQLLAPICG